ncbi:hypothetical protein UA08_00986 [Talaromyces atroroseus]|uniref:Crh-like protein n=1 Tax=Talaromyces atroroseus TaxID=1441469 RepID=A0A225ASA8_TALAT|nr:hypothetical protein UA08_00986 [Talaromyces atroroseus]OKL63880.1 hypothetical protein UA08_00986 [Talaromyces atroroseus]
MHSTLANSAALLLAAAIPMASAQTYTSCNPLDSTCPSDSAMGASLNSDFTAGAADGWTVTAGSITYDGSNGAVFTISAEGDAPTIETTDYFFFGTAEVKMQASPGTGIVSSIVLESDDLDEVDWEALGGYTTYIETNYFGKGYTGSYNRSTNADVSSPQTSFHTYTVNWQRDSIQWLIDGAVVRTLTAEEAGDYFPQTPMRLRIGTWAGGDPNNAEGTIEWAGGVTNYADGPFTAYVQSVSITNENPGSSYTYNGNSGSADSIEVNGAYSASTTSSVAPSTTSTVASTTSTSSSSSTTSTSTSSTSSVVTTSSAAETTTSIPLSTSSSSSSSSSSSTSSTPSSTTTTTTTPAVVSSTTFSSVASSTPTIVVPPPIGVNTTLPSNTTTATGTGSPSGSSTPTATPAPQAGSAMPTASVASSAVALYCFLFAIVAYAL